MKRIDSTSFVPPTPVVTPPLGTTAVDHGHAPAVAIAMGATLALGALGIVRVVSVGDHVMAGIEARLIGFESLRDGTRVLLPEARLAHAGIRALMRRDEFPALLVLLSQRASTRRPTCYKWHRELHEKLNRGTLRDTAEVLRDLAQTHNARPLSATERHLFDQVREDVITEIALVTHRSPRGVARQLDKLLALPPAVANPR